MGGGFGVVVPVRPGVIVSVRISVVVGFLGGMAVSRVFSRLPGSAIMWVVSAGFAMLMCMLSAGLRMLMAMLTA